MKERVDGQKDRKTNSVKKKREYADVKAAFRGFTPRRRKGRDERHRPYPYLPRLRLVQTDDSPRPMPPLQRHTPWRSPLGIQVSCETRRTKAKKGRHHDQTFRKSI